MAIAISAWSTNVAFLIHSESSSSLAIFKGLETDGPGFFA
jgi:hypothetical protein